ncbi:hypothetical protein VCHA53O466_50137 [Vibrio chagasii]|nr:hypothetical protein VCHA53O466_50137 [Vibrio chagasii]
MSSKALRPILPEESLSIKSTMLAAAKAPNQDLLSNEYKLATANGYVELRCDIKGGRPYFQCEGKHINKSILDSILGSGLIEV